MSTPSLEQSILDDLAQCLFVTTSAAGMTDLAQIVGALDETLVPFARAHRAAGKKRGATADEASAIASFAKSKASGASAQGASVLSIRLGGKGKSK
jgi:hypothetical protein